MFSQTEENYLKAIFKLSSRSQGSVSTNGIAKEMKTSAASVTDMLKRLSEKELINYAKYKGVTLTAEGQRIATSLVRKHRLWEVFLWEKLNFSWDEVHEMAEQLEHIQSDELVERLDKFLGFPKFDPHGDPIPDAEGNFISRQQMILGDMNAGMDGVIVGVREHSPDFLQYLDRLGLRLGVSVRLVERFEYDDSCKVQLNNTEHMLSSKVAQNIYVQKQK